MKYEISIGELKTIVDLVESAQKDLGLPNIVCLDMQVNEEGETELNVTQIDPHTKLELVLRINESEVDGK